MMETIEAGNASPPVAEATGAQLLTGLLAKPSRLSVPEPAVRAAPDPACPKCGRPMSEHYGGGRSFYDPFDDYDDSR